MKLLRTSRRQILRAIQLACIALFLAAIASRAHAQVFTPPFVVNGTTVTTSPPGTYTSPVGFFDNVHTYSSISVSSGVIINSTAEFNGTIGNVFANINTTAQSVSNAGTLTINTTSGPYQAVVNLNNQGATSVTVNNTGTMTSTDTFSNFAVNVGGSSGNATVTNSGTMSANGGPNSAVVSYNTVSGNLSFTNTASGTVTLGGGATGFLVNAITGNAGNVTFSNAGTMTSSSGGVQLETNTGTVQASNTGTIQVSGAGNYGISVRGSSNVSVTNSGSITGSGSKAGIEVQAGAAPITISNSNSISGFNSGLVGFATGPVSATNTGTLTVSTSGIYVSSGTSATLTNSGAINSGGTGINSLSAATVSNSGNITSTGDSITVTSGSSVTLSGRPIISNLISGGPTAASTSTLAFDLTIPTAQLAASQAQLNTEIAGYAGGPATFTIDGLVYDITNFAANGITDGLIASRIYADVPGFSGLGTAIDNFGVNPASIAILNALGNVSDAGLPNALAELSPKQLEVFRNVAFDNNTFYDEQVNDHLANLRDGLTGFDTSALAINTSNMDPSLSQIRDHLLAYNPADRPGLISDITDPVVGAVDPKDMKDTKSVQVTSEPSTRWSTFIAGNVILASLDNSQPYQNTQYTSGAVTAGADYRLDDHFTVGAIFSYAHSGIDLDYLGSKATVDSYAPGVYGSYVNSGWYANGLATYVRNSYTEDRMIDIPGIAGDNHGSTSGNQGTGNFTGGYEFQKGSFKFGPVATVEYVHLDIHPLDETGPTALHIDDQSADSLRSLLGFEGRFATAVDSCYGGKVILTPHFSASWQHEYLDNSNGITSQFSQAGGGSFSVQTDQPERDSAFIDTGLDAKLDTTTTLFVDYQVQAGQSNFFAQSVQGGIQISF